MPLRRRAAFVLAAVTTFGTLTAPVARADTAPAATVTATPSRSDLYGRGDPTHDGVWRQAYAEMAVARSGYFVNGAATNWLLAQQCADGGWPSYRADTAKPCDPKTEDTNATGMALQALRFAAVGGPSTAALAKGHAWLLKIQNPDGGWSYNPGGPSDPDSTAVVMGGLGHDAGLQPNAKGKSPYEALLGFQFGCDAKAADRGAFGHPGTGGKLTPNAKATADAVEGLAAAGLTGYSYVAPSTPATPPKPADCTGNPQAYTALDPNAAASAAADWLVAGLHAGGGHFDAVTPGTTTPAPDYGTTSQAVIALNSLGRSADSRATSSWLTANSASWSRGNPAALAQLVIADGGRTALDGGSGALQQLIALGPAPAKRPTGAISMADKKDGSSGATTWIVVGVVLVASIGAGLLIAARRRRQS